ncbi:conjugal transfer protein TraH [Marinobacter sp. F3R08]|uniref:conjugal transfer protein TraH n=1 Tax=Marinobacter sp. F3R08 TaxID=2841559 RepID=UPI001C095B95|nr:conjugal transfer protein TraH [Marinobacter sp. F3R08]MBU2952322.1 conjugal transfer protein TraH [Marinobacter sp. F3R08]
MNKRISKLNVLAGATLAATSILVSAPSSAGMQDQMESMFGQMANATDPSAFKSKTRGGMTFGGVSIRTPIVDQNIATWVPPSASGGCGGIDMSGGSFSFIDGQEIVNTLQKVAANAEGYAFQLALDAVYPEGAAWIETFQKKMQSLNEYLGNSCQLAQGIVNDTAGAFDLAQNSQSRTEATIGGATEDFFQSWSDNWTPQNAQTNPETAQFYEDSRGNFVYRAMIEGGAVSIFPDGDKDMAEHLMSLLGAVIVPLTPQDGTYESSPAFAGKTGDKVNISQYVSPTFDLEAFVFGRSGPIASSTGSPAPLQVFRCGTSADDEKYCDEPTVQTSDFEGFAEKVLKALVGSASSPGIINKMTTNQGTFTLEEKGIFISLPEAQGTWLRNVAVKAPGAAQGFAKKAAYGLALDMAFRTAQKAIDATIDGLNSIKGARVKEAIEKLETRRTIITDQYWDLRENHIGNPEKLANTYETIMRNTTAEDVLKVSGMK